MSSQPPPPSHSAARAPSPLAQCLAAGRHVQRRLAAADMKLKRDVPTLMLRDQVLMTCGISLVVLFVAVLFGWPQRFPLAHVALWPLNFAWLVFSFAVRRRWQLFLADFCYLVNHSAWLFFVSAAIRERDAPPDRDALFAVLFVCASGPILMAHLPWRVSLTFHKPDSMASVFTHTVAPLAVCAYRWTASGAMRASGDLAPAPSLAYLVAAPLCTYALWQAAYLVLTEGLLGAWLAHDPRQMTSLRWLVATHAAPTSKATLAARALGFVRPGGTLDESTWGTKAFFVSAQGAYTLVTVLLGAFAFRSRAINTLLLALVIVHAVWQGSSFYMTHFALRYAEECAAKVRLAANGGGALDHEPVVGAAKGGAGGAVGSGAMRRTGGGTGDDAGFDSASSSGIASPGSPGAPVARAYPGGDLPEAPL